MSKFRDIVLDAPVQSVMDPSANLLLPISSEVLWIDFNQVVLVCPINMSLVVVKLCILRVAVHSQVFDDNVIVVQIEIGIPYFCLVTVKQCNWPFIRKVYPVLFQICSDFSFPLRFVVVPKSVLVGHVKEHNDPGLYKTYGFLRHTGIQGKGLFVPVRTAPKRSGHLFHISIDFFPSPFEHGF